MFGIAPETGAIISGIIAILIFLRKEAGLLMDRFAQLMGFIMIALTFYVMFKTEPPVVEAAYRTFIPEQIDPIAIVTLVGGTVGGYITFAGAHRLLDAGIQGEKAMAEVSRSSVSAILIASTMRIVLFLRGTRHRGKAFLLILKTPLKHLLNMWLGIWGKCYLAS